MRCVFSRALSAAVASVVNHILGRSCATAVSAVPPKRKIQSAIEPLERRQLLTTVTGSAIADSFYLRSDEEYQNIQVWVNANPATDAPTHTYDRYDIDSLIINAAGGDDTLTLDLSNGNPLRDDIFTFNGEDGADTIDINGRDVSKGTYTPSATTTGSGTFMTARKDGSFTGVESINADTFQSFKLVAPADAENLTLDTPNPNVGRITESAGSSNNSFVPLTVTNLNKFTLDAAAHDIDNGADSITIASTGFAPSGLAANSPTVLVPLTGTGDDALAVTGGTTNLDATMAGGFLAVTTSNSAILNLTSIQYLHTLTLNDSSRVNLPKVAVATATTPASPFKILYLDGLLISGSTAKLDLADNDIVIHNGNLSEIQTYIKNAYGTGTPWQGSSGLTSSTAAADPQGKTAIGFIRASDDPNRTVWDGQEVTGTDVLVKFAYEGDNNLDAEVSISDQIDLAANYNQGSGKMWRQGDFNYDGSVTISDWIDQASNWQSDNPVFSLAGAASTDEGSTYTLDLTTTVSYVTHYHEQDPETGEWFDWDETTYIDPLSSWSIYWGDGTFDVVSAIQHQPNSETTVTLPVTHTYADDSGQSQISVFAKGAQMNYFAASRSVPILPAAPDLTASQISSGATDLIWVDNSLIETGYTLERSIDGVNWISIPISPTATSYHDTLAASATFYSYRLAATNGSGSSRFSYADAAPSDGSPTNLTATALDDSSIQLSWSDNTNNEMGFEIDWSSDGINFGMMDEVPAGQTSFTSTDSPMEANYFQVRAVSSFGSTSPSNTASATPFYPLLASDDANSYNVAVNGQLTTTAINGLLANDDQGGSAIQVASYNNPLHGSLTVNSDGSFTYQPDAGFSGDDTFTYTLENATQTSDPAIVTLHVAPGNAPPEATSETYSLQHDMPLNTATSNGLALNDHDPEYETLTYAVAPGGDPHHGDLTLNSEGTFTYVPDEGWVGVDRFKYLANDGTSDSNPASATIVTTASPALVQNDYFGDVNRFGGPINSSVANNDSNIESGTFELVEDVASGTLTFDDDGTFTYQPNDGFSGVDKFKYKASGGGISNIATAVIDIRDSDGTAHAVWHAPHIPLFDSVQHGQHLENGIPLADSGSPNLEPITAVLVEPPALGHLTLNSDGTFGYDAPNDFFGWQKFKYKVQSSAGESEISTFYIEILNRLPSASDSTYSLFQDGKLIVDAENLPDNQLLASSMAYDPDDEPLSIRDLPPDFLPKHGTLSLSPDGSFAYTPEDGFIGHDSFSYQLTDHVEQTEYSQAGDFFGSNIITAQINVNPAYVGLAVGDRPDGDNKGILVASMPVLEDADLVPLHLTFPANLPNGTTYTLALNGSAAENIGVWTTNSTAHAADKILGAGAPANKTWTKGANAPAPPTTFYLQGVHQSGWRKPQFTFTVTQPGGKDRNANVRATVREAQSLTIGFYGADDPHFPNDGNKKMMKIFDRIPLDNNHRFKSLQWGDAAKKLHSWADTNGDGHYDPAHGDKARPIRMLGHSWGAKSAINLAWDIHDDDFYRDKTIEVLAVIDPVTHVRGNFNQGVPDNVNYFWNRWQRNKLIPVHALGIDWFFPRGDVIPNVPASSFPSQVEVTAVPPPSTTPIDHWNIIDVVANDAIAIMGGTP